MDKYINKLVYYLRANEYDKADVIGIFVTSRPEFIAIILALSKLGAIGVPLNTNLKKNVLMRCINVARCRAIVVSENLIPCKSPYVFPNNDFVTGCISAIQPIKSLLRENNVQIFQVDGKLTEKGVIDLQSELQNMSSEAIKLPYKNHSIDPLLYYYSIGPKGLPSAAIIPNSK